MNMISQFNNILEESFNKYLKKLFTLMKKLFKLQLKLKIN